MHDLHETLSEMQRLESEIEKKEVFDFIESDLYDILKIEEYWGDIEL